MLREERIDNLPEAMLTILRGWQADIWTALPGIITSFNPIEMTCEVQPTIQAKLKNPDGTRYWQSLPILTDCPVHFPSGGGYSLTFPVKPGDECLVVFSSRCIDNWWDSGKVGEQRIMRMHDLSDGFVFVGVRSRVKAIQNVSSTAVQLRSDSGDTSVAIDGSVINLTSPTAVVVNAPTINLQDSGASLHKLVNDTFMNLFNTHKHSGVQTGGGTSAVPTSPMTTTHLTSTTEAE